MQTLRAAFLPLALGQWISLSPCVISRGEREDLRPYELHLEWIRALALHVVPAKGAFSSLTVEGFSGALPPRDTQGTKILVLASASLIRGLHGCYGSCPKICFSQPEISWLKLKQPGCWGWSSSRMAGLLLPQSKDRDHPCFFFSK